MSRTVPQRDLESVMLALSAIGGGRLDMGGAEVPVTDPPFTVPRGVTLAGCSFLVQLAAPGPARFMPLDLSGPMPDIRTGEGDHALIRINDDGQLIVEIGP